MVVFPIITSCCHSVVLPWALNLPLISPVNLLSFRLMRLLHTTTLRLKEFTSHVPPYAILSHTWEEDEVLFRDLQSSELNVMKNKAGYPKIESSCKTAHDAGFEYIWIDTCCIDKESSAELSEAINSMYKYYGDAKVCYVYLSDFSGNTNIQANTFIDSAIGKCRWFTRGWTLQELLAPSAVIFFTKEWKTIGTKTSLAHTITDITGIPVDVLLGVDCSTISIAKRMSWAANRQTTREEDRAYSLMGIFGVHIPPLYGEGGPNAFMRLQQEIIKYSDDRSIFAWTALDGDRARGLFAESPSEFSASGHIFCSIDDDSESPYSMTNIGLHIDLPLIPISHNQFLAFLDCQLEQEGENLAIYLQKQRGKQYVRCQSHEVVISDLPATIIREKAVRQAIYVKDPSTEWRNMPSSSNHTSLPIRVRLLSSLRDQFYLKEQFVHLVNAEQNLRKLHSLPPDAPQ
ncbi:HET-domain-containing protein, partial [Dendrothele bispora CBS 962.96]